MQDSEPKGSSIPARERATIVRIVRELRKTFRTCLPLGLAGLTLLVTPVAARPVASELRRELMLASGPHAPADAPDVALSIPAGFDAAAPLELVVYLHGFEGCARALLNASPISCRASEARTEGWDLAGLHQRAGTNSVLLIPQLAYRTRDAHHHRFATPGAFDALLTEVLSALAEAVGGRSLADVHGVTLVAHSAGYGAVVPILQDRTRKAPVRNVVMLDALYAGWDALAAWYERTPDARIVSLHTAQAQTVHGNAQLARLLHVTEHGLVRADTLRAAVAKERVLIARVDTAHRAVPQVHLAAVLAGLLRAPPTSP
jgi:hypothetical protein